MDDVTHIIGIDVETTGCVLGTHHLLAIGAAVVEVSPRTPLLNKLLLKVDVQHATWEPRCIAEFWSNHADIVTALTTEDDSSFLTGPFKTTTAAKKFAAFLEGVHKMLPPSAKTLIVSDMLLFDGQWLNDALAEAELRPLYFKADGSWQSSLDTDSFEDGIKATGQDLPAVDMSGVPVPSHMPDVDATYVATKFARTLLALRAKNSNK